MADRGTAKTPAQDSADEPMPRVPRQLPPKRSPPGGNAVASQASPKAAAPAKQEPQAEPKKAKKVGAKVSPPKRGPVPVPAPPPPLPLQPAPVQSTPLEMPGQLQGARAARVSRFAQQVATGKQRVETAVVTSQARVLQTAGPRIQQLSDAYDEHQRAIVKEVGERTTELATLRRTTKASVESVRSTRMKLVETRHTTESERTTKLVDTKTQAATKATAGRGDELETYAETNAKHVESTTAKNIDKANQIAKTKGDFYKDGPRGDDIVEMANELAKETVENFQQRGKETADSIREDTEPVVRELRKMGTDLAKEYAKQGKGANETIDKAKREADAGLEKLAHDAAPHIDEGINAALGQLPVMQRSALLELGKLRAHIVTGLHVAAMKLVGVLGIGGKQRVDEIDRAGREVLARREELERGDATDLDQALTAHELGIERGAAGYVSELDLAATRGLADLDGSIGVGLGAGDQLGSSVKAGLEELVQKTREPIEKAVEPIASEADKLVETSTGTMSKANDELEKSYDESLAKLAGEVDPKFNEAKKHIDDKVNECLPSQDKDLTELEQTIDKKAKELINESRAARFFKAIGGFLWGVLSFFVGLIVGVLWAIVKLIIGIVLLIVALIVILVALVVALVVLFVVLVVLLGSELAALIVAIIALVVLAVIAVVVIVALVIGIVMTIVGIFAGLWKAITGKGLSWFDRGFLVGESLGDALLLLLPFKAKVPGLRAIKFPRWMPKFIVGEHPTVPEPSAPKLPISERPPEVPIGERPPELPAVEPPVSELPRTEAPVVETPKVETPVGEAPAIEKPPVPETPPAPEKPTVPEEPVKKPTGPEKPAGEPEKPVDQPSAEQPTAKEEPKQPAEEPTAKEEPKQPAEEPQSKTAKDAQEAAAEEAAIEAEAAREKVPPEEAENWEQVQKLLGPPPKKLGKRPPKGYTIYERGGRRFLRRKDADPKKFVQLTVDENGHFALPKASQRISVPGKLAENLGPRPPAVSGAIEPHQAHHLIPDEVVRKNPLLQLAREKAGYNLDRGSNGVYLPETAAARDATPVSKGLPLHRGSHPTYSSMADEMANKELLRLVEKYGGRDKIPPEELVKAVETVENKMRDIIKHWESLTGKDKLF